MVGVNCFIFFDFLVGSGTQIVPLFFKKNCNMNLSEKVNQSLKVIKAASENAINHNSDLELCYSGGKDSDVLLRLTQMAQVPFRGIYKNTTIDPPKTIKHCIDNSIEIVQPTETFWQIVQRRGLPFRKKRICCAFLKEYKILDYALLGIRREESSKRAKRYKEPEQCRVYRDGERTLQYYPILQWSKDDVKEFIIQEQIKLHPLYYNEEGQLQVERRLGCIGCPISYYRRRIEELKKYPKIVKMYIKNAQIFLDTRPNSQRNNAFKNGYEYFLFNLRFERISEYQEVIGDNNLFGEGLDAKKCLEDLLEMDL